MCVDIEVVSCRQSSLSQPAPRDWPFRHGTKTSHHRGDPAPCFCRRRAAPSSPTFPSQGAASPFGRSLRHRKRPVAGLPLPPATSQIQSHRRPTQEQAIRRRGGNRRRQGRLECVGRRGRCSGVWIFCLFCHLSCLLRGRFALSAPQRCLRIQSCCSFFALSSALFCLVRCGVLFVCCLSFPSAFQPQASVFIPIHPL